MSHFFLGEITMISPARVEDTEDGRYDLVIRATDSGRPTLHRDVKVRRAETHKELWLSELKKKFPVRPFNR